MEGTPQRSVHRRSAAPFESSCSNDLRSAGGVSGAGVTAESLMDSLIDNHRLF